MNLFCIYDSCAFIGLSEKEQFHILKCILNKSANLEEIKRIQSWLFKSFTTKKFGKEQIAVLINLMEGAKSKKLKIIKLQLELIIQEMNKQGEHDGQN